MKLSFSLAFMLVLVAGNSLAQKQLVLIKKGTTIAQYAEGQYIRLKLKNGKRTEGHILELDPFSMITSSDTIQFSDIRKVDIRKQRKFNVSSGIGGLLFLGGILYISLDRLNSSIGKGPPELDSSVLNTSVIMTTVGAALIFIKPRYIRVNYKVNLRTVDYNSNFYKK
jgi:small nuclear ribonucleoprotein (snRNP)-like protein